MPYLLMLGAILAPVAMFVLRRYRMAAVAFDLLAAISVLLANLSAGLAVLAIKQHNTEFTTEVHSIFVDPMFLGAAGYIGIYSVYRLMMTTLRRWQHHPAS